MLWVEKVGPNMRRLGATVGVTLVCIPFLGAQQSPMTEDEYEAAMTEINLLMGDAEQHIDARYWPELLEDLAKLRSELDRVEAFWSVRGSEEAAAMVRQVIEEMSPVAAAADSSDPQEARAAIRAVRGTCQSCHEAFREDADGGYRIKR